MKPSTTICFMLFLLGMGLGLLQLWFTIWSADIFFKIIVTVGALFAISFVWAFLVKESKANAKINKSSGLE